MIKISKEGASGNVSDTLPIGASVYWDDSKEIPSNWEVVEDVPFNNRNLLINGDFQINQRGQSTYTSQSTTIYTIDMWKINAGSLTVNHTPIQMFLMDPMVLI